MITEYYANGSITVVIFCTAVAELSFSNAESGKIVLTQKSSSGSALQNDYLLMIIFCEKTFSLFFMQRK